MPARVREFFVEAGRRGGMSSRRELTRQQAKQMVDIREAKRAAKRRGQTNEQKFKIDPAGPRVGKKPPQIKKRSFPTFAR